MTLSEAEGRSNRRVGIREVAQHAGVAMSSVSRVLSNHPDVSEPMRQKVMVAVAELGYQPDILAQSLRRQTTLSVGFAASDISNPVLAETITGAEGVLRAAGYSMLVTDAGSQSEVDVENVAALQQRRVDGLLLAPSDEHDPALAPLLQGLDTPFVLVDRDTPAGVDAPQVRFQHRQGMRQAAEYLWSCGHRRVALISGGPRGPASERRLGIGEVFDEADGALLEFCGPFSSEHGERSVATALAAAEPPTTIVAGANIYMLGALRELRRRELVLGRDISFVGCDDVAVAEFHDPPIAVVRREPRLAGATAARLLLAQMTGQSQPEGESGEVVLPTEFIARSSVGLA